MGVTPNSVPVTQAISNDLAQLSNGTGNAGTGWTTSPSNTVLLTTAGANGSVLKSLIASSDDSSARVLTLYLSPDSGTTKYAIGSVSIAATAGNTGAIASTDLLSSTLFPGLAVDGAGKLILELAASMRLYVGVQTTITSGKLINVFAQREDF